ncbi:hypothetical protein OQA88_12561 [Cercophora sp. LCS_1]
MESFKRLASVRRRPSTAVASRSPIPAHESSSKPSTPKEADLPPLSPPPQIHIDRSDTASVLVDPTDPAAALAKLASEAVVGLVRRAKSTRGPRRANSTTVAPTSSRRPQSLDLPTHDNLLDGDERPKTSLKTRPSLRQKFSSRTNKPTLIVDAPPVPDANPRTPTDPTFVHRPKHAGIDLTHLASSLQVPRDSHDAPTINVTPPRLSFDTTPSNNNNNSHDLSRTKSAREHATHADLNRAPGECRRCHSKRVQRSQSTRQPTEKEIEAGIINNPFIDPANTKPPSPPRLSIPSDKEKLFGSDTDSATPSTGRGHTKAAPSWASFNGGDDDEVKVVEYRKSRVEETVAQRPPTQPQALKPMPVTTEPVPGVRRENTMPAELPPRTLRRERSVAQRIVDYIRPAGRRGVKAGSKKFF